MEPLNNSLKWMTFSGLAEDYPTWRSRFSAFAQTKGLFETLTDTVELPDRPAPQRGKMPMVRKGENTRQRLKLELQL